MSVGIVVTTFERPEWLRDCLASIPAECQVVVVDDAVRREGFTYARMRGLEQLDTEYVAFFDDDDVMLPNWLPEHLEAMAGYDVVAGSYIETDADLVPLRKHFLPPATLADFERGHCPVNDGALIRRSVLDGITWHPELDKVMMFRLWSDLLRAGARFTSTTTPSWLRRLHDGNMSAHLGDMDPVLREMVFR